MSDTLKYTRYRQHVVKDIVDQIIPNDRVDYTTREAHLIPGTGVPVQNVTYSDDGLSAEIHLVNGTAIAVAVRRRT
jgi:hypothetical protein